MRNANVMLPQNSQLRETAVGKSVLFFHRIKRKIILKIYIMLSLKIKTNDFINLVNKKIIEISASDLEELKSKIEIVPEQKENAFKISDNHFLKEFKKVFSTYSVIFELI